MSQYGLSRASRDLKSHILIVLSFSFLCPQTLPRPSSFNHFINNALWVGFYKTDNISEDIKVLKTFISFYPMYGLLHVPWLVIPCDLFIFLSTELITTLSVISCSLWFIRVQTRGWRLSKIVFSFLSFSRESSSFFLTSQFYFLFWFFFVGIPADRDSYCFTCCHQTSSGRRFGSIWRTSVSFVVVDIR